jgi:hypothetical protein
MARKPKPAYKTFVVVKCVSCGATRNVGPNEIPADEIPLCEKDGMPMIAQKAVKIEVGDGEKT